LFVLCIQKGVSMRLSILVCILVLSTTGFSEKGSRPQERPEAKRAAPSTTEAVKERLEKERAKERDARAGGTELKGGSITEGAMESAESKPQAKGHTVEKAAVSSSRRGAPSKKKSEDTQETIFAEIEKVLAGEKNKVAREAILGSLKAEYAKVKRDSDAHQGMLVRERMWLDSLGGKQELGDKEARVFEGKLLDRLAKDKDNPTREELSTLASLLCPDECGHTGCARSCRRLKKFLGATTAIVSTAALAAAWRAYAAYQRTGKENDISVSYTDENGNSQTLEIKDIDQPVAEETVTTPKSTK
jgi:hypothetical protein